MLDVMDELREKCPWDRKQTYESLRPNTIEETFELCDALLKHDTMNICKELGDVLLHVVFYAKIGSEDGDYDIADVCNKLCDKLIFRHPHVYGDVVAKNAGDVVENWEKIKQKEKDGNKTVLSGVPNSLPSLIKAYPIQDKARNVGFAWDKKEDVWDKVREEQGEFQAELEAMAVEEDGLDVNVNEAPAPGSARDRAEEELGDFMFAVINAARLYGLNPDTALNRACDKFRRRFTYLEENTIRKGRNLTDMTLAEMDAIWDEGKAKGL